MILLYFYNNKLYIANNHRIDGDFLISQVDLSNNQGIQNWGNVSSSINPQGLLVDNAGLLYVSSYTPTIYTLDCNLP